MIIFLMQTLLLCNHKHAAHCASLQNHLWDNGSVWKTSYAITCSAPPAGDRQLPVFLAELPAEGNAGRQYIALAQGTYTQSPGSAEVPEADVFPLLGPMGGGTEVMLQVSSSLVLQLSIFVCVHGAATAGKHVLAPRNAFLVELVTHQPSMEVLASNGAVCQRLMSFCCCGSQGTHRSHATSHQQNCDQPT